MVVFASEKCGVDRPRKFGTRCPELAGIDKRDFDAYYSGRTIAYALEITDVWEYKNPVDLNALRNQFRNFVVPQSWRYVRPDECRFFLEMKRQTMALLRKEKRMEIVA